MRFNDDSAYFFGAPCICTSPVIPEPFGQDGVDLRLYVATAMHLLKLQDRGRCASVSQSVPVYSLVAYAHTKCTVW